MRIKPDELYYLIKYRIKAGEKLEVCMLGENHDDFFDMTNWTSLAGENFKLLTDFFITELTRPVAEGMEYLYRSSSMIAKRHFDMSNNDGWQYPSIAYGTGYNMALKKESVDRAVEFAGLRICVYVTDTPKGEAVSRVSPLWSDSITNGEIHYEKTKPCPVVISGLLTTTEKPTGLED